LQYEASIVALGGPNFGVVTVLGNKNIQAEQFRDYEIGYRAQISKRFSMDLASFRGYYRNYESSTPGIPYFVDAPAPAHLIIPLDIGNGARAQTWGGEVFATWNVNNRWRLSPGYSLIHLNLIQDPLSQNAGTAIVASTPKHQIELRSALSLRANLDWDTSLYFVGQVNDNNTPRYTRLDTQLRWRPLEALEFSITGQNLLTPRHAEFGDSVSIDYTQVQRSVLGKITWRF
jgi:outer membrane receptor protein involved in Fe transport